MKKPPHTIRKMGKYKVSQRKKDGMFNVNDFLREWNKSNPKEKVNFLKVNEWLRLDKVKEFMLSMGKTENKIKDVNLVKDGGTWFHPVLFIEFVGWVNPDFKTTAIQLVYEQLLDIRQDTADNYRSLSSVANKLDGFDSNSSYQEIANGINWIVFNYKGNRPRERANETQLKDINTIEQNLIFLIEMGFVQSYEHLISTMKRIYRKKYPKT